MPHGAPFKKASAEKFTLQGLRQSSPSHLVLARCVSQCRGYCLLSHLLRMLHAAFCVLICARRQVHIVLCSLTCFTVPASLPASRSQTGRPAELWVGGPQGRSSPVCARQHCMRCCSATEAGKGHHHASVWCDEPLLPRRSSTEAGKGHPAPAGISVRATAGTASPAAPAGGTAAEGAALKPAGGTPSAGPAPAGGAENLWPRGTCAQRYWSCPGAAGYKIRGPTYLRVRLCMRLQLRMSFWVSLLLRRVPCMQVWPF